MRLILKPWVIVLLLIIVGSFILASVRLAGSFKQAALNEAQLEGVGAVNRAVLGTVTDQVKYDRLVIVRQDSQGQVVLVQPNPMEISRIVALTQLAVRDQLLTLAEKKVLIPIGQVAGSPLLASWGPRVSARIVPVGTVKVHLKDSFESAGINQTRHLIVLEIQSDLKVIVPFYSGTVKVATSMPLAETIIVGRIPSTYIRWEKGAKIIGGQP